MRIYYNESGEIHTVEKFRRGPDGKDDPSPGDYIEADWDLDAFRRSDYTVKNGKIAKKTTAEIATIDAAAAAVVEIKTLKASLAETDYIMIKIAEGAATAEEYADEIKSRQAARARINELGG